MKHTTKIICGLALFITSGCTTARGFPKRSENVKAVLSQINTTYSMKNVFDTYKGHSDKVTYRNEVIAARMMAIDIRFAQFQKEMFSQRSYLMVGGDTAKSVMSAAGALTTAGQTSQILSGLTGAFDAGSASVDNNIYKNQTQIAIMSMMNAGRIKVRARMESRLQKNTAAYPLAAALSDLEDYYMAGSIPGALAAITKTAGEEQAVAEEKLDIEYNKTKALDVAKKNLTDIDNFKVGEAKKILENQPSILPNFIQKVAGINKGSAAISGLKDDQAKASIKRIMVLIKDRESDIYKGWTAAILAAEKK